MGGDGLNVYTQVVPVGVCGKTPEVSGLQDLLIYQLKGISQFSIRLRALNIEMPEVNKFVTDSLFMTITNANFDYDRFVNKIIEGFELRDKAKMQLPQILMKQEQHKNR